MNVIYRSRQSGKTTQLIQLAAKENLYIVCANFHEAKRISNNALKLELTIPYPLTFNEFHKGLYYEKNIKSILIDNADEYIQWVANKMNTEVHTITMTDGE